MSSNSHFPSIPRKPLRGNGFARARLAAALRQSFLQRLHTTSCYNCPNVVFSFLFPGYRARESFIRSPNMPGGSGGWRPAKASSGGGCVDPLASATNAPYFVYPLQLDKTINCVRIHPSQPGEAIDGILASSRDMRRQEQSRHSRCTRSTTA